MKPSEMFSHWEQVRTDLLMTIDKFNLDELSYVPFKGSWSVGQIMLHIAECENDWLHRLVRQEIGSGTDFDLSNHPTATAIKETLCSTRKKTIALLESLKEDDLEKVYTTPDDEKYTLNWIIWHVLEHEIHHRGELSLALGLLGREGLDV